MKTLPDKVTSGDKTPGRPARSQKEIQLIQQHMSSACRDAVNYGRVTGALPPIGAISDTIVLINPDGSEGLYVYDLRDNDSCEGCAMGTRPGKGCPRVNVAHNWRYACCACDACCGIRMTYRRIPTPSSENE